MSTTSLYVVNITATENGTLAAALQVNAPADGTTVLIREYVGPIRLDTVAKMLAGMQQELGAYGVNTTAIRLDLKTAS